MERICEGFNLRSFKWWYWFSRRRRWNCFCRCTGKGSDPIPMDVDHSKWSCPTQHPFTTQKLDAPVQHHAKFQTAVVQLASGLKIDVATARLEYYPSPVSLPTVELSSLKMDLYRRDFSINALGIELTKGSLGRLVDYFHCMDVRGCRRVPFASDWLCIRTSNIVVSVCCIPWVL